MIATCRLRALPIVALLLVFTAACVSDAKPRSIPPGVTPGGHVTVGILAPRSIAPWLTSALDPYGSVVVSTMCDQVLALDPATAALAPSIASSWRYQKANDLLLKLRRGLVFSDGSPVSTGDIADSVSRAARFEVASPVAGVLKLVSGSDFLGGLPTATKQNRRYRERLAGVLSPDPGSLEILLADSRPDAFRFLAHPLASVVPSNAYRKDPAAMERQPVCVGPYRLDGPWQPGTTSIRLSRSPHYKPYRDGLVGAGRGLFDSIEFRILPDRQALESAYRSGALDIAYLPAASASAARQQFGSDVVDAPSPTVQYIGLPTTKAPFDDPTVRVALSMAIDRRAVAGAVPGGLRPLSRFLPGTLGDAYADDTKAACRTTARAEGDAVSARKLLEKDHRSLAGETVSISFNDEFGNRALVEAVAKQWEATFGMHVQLVPVSWSQLLDEAGTTTGVTNAFRLSWRPEVTDPVEYVKPLFASKEVGRTNWSRFAAPPLDRQIDEVADKRVEPRDRATELLGAETMLCIAMPMIPIAQGSFVYAVRQPRLAAAAGRFTDRATGALLLRELYLKERP